LIFLFGVMAAEAKGPDHKKTVASAKKADGATAPKKKNVKKAKKKSAAKPAPAQPTKKPAPSEKKPSAETVQKPAAKPAKPTPSTYTVKKDVVKVQVVIDGAFEAEESAELVLRPEEWSALKVLEAAPHGTKVKKGDVVLKLDPEKLDLALDDVRRELRLAEIAAKQNREQLAALEKMTPLELEAGQRERRMAEEDQKYYFDVARAESLKRAEIYLKYYRSQLEYARQELAELEKMYQDDDLVEETEELVLKRQRDKVEMVEFMVHQQEISHDRLLKTTIPRRDEQITDAVQRQAIQWQKAKIDLPLILNRQRLEVKRKAVQLERLRKKLKNLEADRKLLTVTAPIDGIVYYGRCRRGKFSESTGLIESLQLGGNVAPNRVFMTIVVPRPLLIRTSLSEANLKDLTLGSQGTAIPTARPDLRLPAAIEQIDAVPTAPGSFHARLDVTLEAKDKAIMPGMSCKVKFTPYLKTDALVVPPKAVFAEPEDDDDRYVYVLDKEGEPEKRPVTVGRETGKTMEIRKGLKAGDKILLEEPKDEK
jgi:multidrug efflux pump subunit AcrA (membrane-fusion protein)